MQTDLYYSKGILYNKTQRGSRAAKDAPSGWYGDDGYVRVQLNGKRYIAHRLIWEMFNGPIPGGMEIDHINRVRDDNRIENLRIVSSQENKYNAGAKGYTKDTRRNTYNAKIMKDKKTIHLGSFKTKIEARQAYLKAKEALHVIKSTERRSDSLRDQ